MSSDIAISIENVSKAYRIWSDPSARLKSLLVGGSAGLFSPTSIAHHKLEAKAAAYYRDFYALKDISFQVRKGESVGIIGRNGSGKSTLLQIIAGTLQPTEGNALVNGRVAALLELGSGFNPEFTGRENIQLNAVVLGLSEAAIAGRMDSIIAFADIGDFIDQPVKIYSSGMVVRLAFAVAAHVDAEVLIIDEALGVGDARFQLKCARAIDRFLADGVTLLFVSHDPSSVKRLCNHAVLLEQGHMTYKGTPNDVINLYSKLISEGGSVEAIRPDIDKLRNAESCTGPSHDNQEDVASPSYSHLSRHLSTSPLLDEETSRSEKETLRLRVKALETIIKSQEGGVALLKKCETLLSDDRKHVIVSGNEFSYGGSLGRIHQLSVQDADGQARTWFATGEQIAIRMLVEAVETIADPIFAMTIKSTSGVEVYGTNTLFSKQPSKQLKPGEWREIEFAFSLNLMPSQYFISFGFTQFVGEELLVIHRRYDAIKIEVHGVDQTFGIANLRALITEKRIDRS